MRVEKEENLFYSDDLQYNKLMNAIEETSYPANEDESLHIRTSASSPDYLDLDCQVKCAPMEIPNRKKSLPVSFINMENSNNAIDSAGIFKDDIGHASGGNNPTFKLPNNELTFNGTLKHLQKQKPIVDTSAVAYGVTLDFPCIELTMNELSPVNSERSSKSSVALSSSVSASQFPCESENNTTTDYPGVDISNSKGDSFNSCIESPDLFREDDRDADDDDTEENSKRSSTENQSNNNTNNKSSEMQINYFETCDKVLAKTIEKKLSGVPPPPSVTTTQMSAGDLLRLYKANLPIFENSIAPANPEASNSVTPSKRMTVWFPHTKPHDDQCKRSDESLNGSVKNSTINPDSRCIMVNCTEVDAERSEWPDTLKCRYYGVHYNVNEYFEKFESLIVRYVDWYVGAETASSCTVFSSGLASPTSGQKRKLRSKLAPAKSPGRRLSHLARRRQAFCSASTLADTASSTSKMVLIDRNFFPHRKLSGFQNKKIRTPAKKTIRKTPGKKTPAKKTPAKKTPRKKTPLKKTPMKKTPRKTPSSSKKVSLRRTQGGNMVALLRSQPTIDKSKRALFISPEQSNSNQSTAANRSQNGAVSEKIQKLKRALFCSPDKDVDGANSIDCGDIAARKRKRENDCTADVIPMERCKMIKSFSFCGDTPPDGNRNTALVRRASESQSGTSFKLNDLHEKKLLWAVAQALRERSCGRTHPLWRTHASMLRHVLRILLTLPHNASDILDAKKSTSDTMLKLAREYVYFVVNGSTLDEIIVQERQRIAASLGRVSRLSVYLSESPQEISVGFGRWNSENSRNEVRLQRSVVAKPVLQDTNSNSNSSVASFYSDGASVKSDSLSKDSHARARRQIKFDNLDATMR